MIKIRKHHISSIGNSIIYGWEMFQKLPVERFEWVQNTSQFSKYFREYNENSDERYFLEVDV